MLKAKNKKLNSFEKVVLVINFLFAFTLLVCYLAPYINPASFWPIAFFGMAYIPILCTNAVCLIFWMIRLRWPALISATCILVGSGLMVRNIGFRKQAFETGKASPSLIRVMTYNVYCFLNKSATIKKNTHDAVLQIIKDKQPDIINMQEYFVKRGDTNPMGEAIKTAMQAKYYWFKPIKTTPYDTTGLVIFSKYPIINRDTIPTTNGIETEGIFVDVKRDEKIFRIYCVHLQSTQFSQTDNDYLANGKPNLHESKQIGGKLKLAFIKRGQQVIALKQLLDACPYPYLITGDFNDTPLSFAVSYLQKGLKNAFREKGFGLGVTYYGEYPGFQLDYIMVSRQFSVTNYKILRERLSDHYPVMSDVELN
ncbi:MAG: endonuclease/exonuclease/phosphatase family protein [Mucilaginibacter sp.]|uniref:endonuclease/exonuclease/phosphatase family protein n=1 Tax=Mucilaginibacter sp. TaxID=1882438 RepID=UPI003266D25E